MKKTPTYESLLAIVIGCLILYFVFGKWAGWLYSALGLGLAGLLSKQMAIWIDVAWAKITHAIGFVMTHVLLTIVFFLLLTPIALLYRLFGKNEMVIKNPGETVFQKREHVYRAKDLKNPW